MRRNLSGDVTFFISLSGKSLPGELYKRTVGQHNSKGIEMVGGIWDVRVHFCALFRSKKDRIWAS